MRHLGGSHRCSGPLPRVDVGETEIERVIAVRTAPARDGQDRGVTIPDLETAAVAESAGLTALPYVGNFDRRALRHRSTLQLAMKAREFGSSPSPAFGVPKPSSTLSVIAFLDSVTTST